MQHSELKRIIADQSEQSVKLTNLIEREASQQLEQWVENPQIIIIMGLRRCGKSTLLQQLRAQQPERDYYVNFDDDWLATFELDDFQKWLKVLYELYGEQKTFYFDEIQNVPEWERFARRLHDFGNKLYINASMLSRELGTRLTGRYHPITIYPCSFSEFIKFCDPSASALSEKIYSTKDRTRLKRLFHDYCSQGGLPEYLQIDQAEYLHTLYENIVYKDVIVRHKLTNEKTIKSLIYYLAR